MNVGGQVREKKDVMDKRRSELENKRIRLKDREEGLDFLFNRTEDELLAR